MTTLEEKDGNTESKGQEVLDTALVPIGQEEVEVPDPRAPKNMDTSQMMKAKREAKRLVQGVVQAEGASEMQELNKAASLGAPTQKSASDNLKLMQTNMSVLLKKDGESDTAAVIGKDLVRLRQETSKLNPDAKTGPFKTSFLRGLPLVGNSLVNTLTKISMQYEPVAKQVAEIEQALMATNQRLQQDCQDLVVLYRDIEVQDRAVQEVAYLNELVMRELESQFAQVQDEAKKQRVRNALFRISVRTRNMRAMETIYQQYYFSIRSTNESNGLLMAAIEETVNSAMHLITVGLAIQVALARQRSAINLLNQVHEFLGNTIVANARAIDEQVEKIGDIYKRPIVAIEMIKEAQGHLLSAMNKTNTLKDTAIASAKSDIVALEQLTGEMRNTLEVQESQETGLARR